MGAAPRDWFDMKEIPVTYMFSITSVTLWKSDHFKEDSLIVSIDFLQARVILRDTQKVFVIQVCVNVPGIKCLSNDL